MLCLKLTGLKVNKLLLRGLETTLRQETGSVVKPPNCWILKFNRFTKAGKGVFLLVVVVVVDGSFQLELVGNKGAIIVGRAKGRQLRGLPLTSVKLIIWVLMGHERTPLVAIHGEGGGQVQIMGQHL